MVFVAEPSRRPADLEEASHINRETYTVNASQKLLVHLPSSQLGLIFKKIKASSAFLRSFLSLYPDSSTPSHS